ncbi:hypothetical protein MMC26_006781 [Xylographa opegraphella]|nr:hypothetical protein [Xylographa opegraphella]
MSELNDPRKRSPSLGQKIMSTVLKTVRSLSGNSEKKLKANVQENTESFAERLHREKLDRDQAERNRANTESFLQSGRNGPNIVQTRTDLRVVQEPSRGPSPQRSRMERETARRLMDAHRTSRPRGRSLTQRERHPGKSVTPASPHHRHPTATHAVAHPGTTIRFNSPLREPSSLRSGSPPRHGPSVLAAVPPKDKHHESSPTPHSPGNRARKVRAPPHLHPDRFSPAAWPTPNAADVDGPRIKPVAPASVPNVGERAPAPRRRMQLVNAIPGQLNLKAEGLYGIPGLLIPHKPFPAQIKRAPAADALRGPGIEGSRQIEPGLEFQPVSARVSLMSSTPPPEDADAESPVSPLTEVGDHLASAYCHLGAEPRFERIVADQAPILRTPTVLKSGRRHNRFSGSALAHMHVNLCENCNSRPLSETSRNLCSSCEDLFAAQEGAPLSPILSHDETSHDTSRASIWDDDYVDDVSAISPISSHYDVSQNVPLSYKSPHDGVLCPRCCKTLIEVPGAPFCRMCGRQLGFESVGRPPTRGSNTLGRPSTSPYASNPRPAMADRARTAVDNGASTRSEAPGPIQFAHLPPPMSTLNSPFSPSIPVELDPTETRERKPTPPPKSSPYLRANPHLTDRHQHVVSNPFPKPLSYPTQPPAARTRTHGPTSSGNLTLSSFPPPRTDSLPPPRTDSQGGQGR